MGEPGKENNEVKWSWGTDFGEKEDKYSTFPSTKNKWTVMCPGKRNQLLQDKWGDDGKKRYKEIGKIIQACWASGEVHKAHIENWNNCNKRQKCVPIHKQRNKDTDDETAMSEETWLESMPEHKVTILEMVNEKSDFSDVLCIWLDNLVYINGN